MSPTVLADVPASARVCSSEVFAPVVVVSRFRELDDAISRVNDSRYGLHAGVITNDLAGAWRAFRELDVSGVIINDIPGYRTDHMPYGGVKESGTGREGVRYSMDEMTELRVMVVVPPRNASAPRP
jgi:acyl-CoA reductase-like NAD-dependent aldehyde dehydrogenase